MIRKISPREYVKLIVQLFLEGLRNLFRFIPSVGPKTYLKQTKMDNQIVIVTGANSGIGKATAKEMAKRGAKVSL